MPTGPNPDIDTAAKISLIVGFGPEESVTATLKALARLVDGVIVEFAPLLRAST